MEAQQNEIVAHTASASSPETAQSAQRKAMEEQHDEVAVHSSASSSPQSTESALSKAMKAEHDAAAVAAGDFVLEAFSSFASEPPPTPITSTPDYLGQTPRSKAADFWARDSIKPRTHRSHIFRRSSSTKEGKRGKDGEEKDGHLIIPPPGHNVLAKAKNILHIRTGTKDSAVADIESLRDQEKEKAATPEVAVDEVKPSYADTDEKLAQGEPSTAKQIAGVAGYVADAQSQKIKRTVKQAADKLKAGPEGFPESDDSTELDESQGQRNKGKGKASNQEYFGIGELSRRTTTEQDGRVPVGASLEESVRRRSIEKVASNEIIRLASPLYKCEENHDHHEEGTHLFKLTSWSPRKMISKRRKRSSQKAKSGEKAASAEKAESAKRAGSMDFVRTIPLRTDNPQEPEGPKSWGGPGAIMARVGRGIRDNGVALLLHLSPAKSPLSQAKGEGL